MASLQYINVGEGCRFCPDWIRVLTKLPDEDGTYLTCNLIGDTAYICMSHFYNGKFDTKDVTHWMPLQKKIYQDAHGEIGKDQFVIFLDGNTENFALDNLYPIDRKISATMSKYGWWSKERESTLAAIKWCELYYTMKGENQ